MSVAELGRRRPSSTPVHAEMPVMVNRLSYGDTIRVLGTVAVVLGHAADVPVFQGQQLSTNWWIALGIDAFCRWAVPAYVMLSGAILLDPQRDQSPSHFYRRRLSRLGVPIVFWSAFFMLFSVYYTHDCTPRQAIINLIQGEPYQHMHFLFRIAGLYALTPMLRVTVKHASRRLLRNSIVILFVIWSCDSLINGIHNNEDSAFSRFAPFMAYYLCGYYLRNYRVDGKRLALFAAGFVGSVVLLVLSCAIPACYVPVHPFPSRSMLFYDFLSPIRIVMGICAWVLLTNLPRNPLPSSTARFIGILAPATLGIYLVHPAIRELLTHSAGFDPVWPSAGIGLPLFALLLYCLSASATLLLMRIPYVRTIVV